MARIRKGFARWIALGAFAALGTFASAFIDDAKILIDRALNSPTLTVRYSSAAAAMVELKVNGISLGTRTVSPSKKSGETSFHLDLATLADGENDVEVRLFDKSGKLIGTQKSTIVSDDPTASPVRLANPRMGATVLGPVEIKVGFGKELKNSYVSFFVNNQFRSMTNQHPFSYVWDTTKESNGWHELEAWVVDETSATFKTRKTRVFVNNPSGRTERRTLPVEPITSTVPAAKAATGSQTGLRNVAAPTTAVAGTIPTVTPPKVAGVAAPNDLRTQTGTANGLKPAKADVGVTAGAKLMVPTAALKTAATTTPAPKGVSAPERPGVMEIKVSAPKVAPVTPALSMVSVTKGAKVAYSGKFAITLDAKVIEFDVQPRVTDGVPLTPIRHLLEGAGGEVKWNHDAKEVAAFTDGREIYVRIGDRIAKINNLPVEMELAPFLERGRTIVPLSFIRETLDVEIQFDSKTGHVLITSAKK
jgi:hypothetical protein